MKKIFLIIILAAITISFTYPQTFKYQALLRDNNGTVLTNKNVGLKISILQGTALTTSYAEESNKTSDEFGTINLEIGTGTVLSGNYLTIDWSKGNNQLKIEIDINGGRDYTLLGISPILSVPVANYAVKAGSAGFPAGTIVAFAGATAKIPAGWLPCDGTAYSRATYPALSDVIDNAFGGSATSFNVPDMRRRVPVGAGGTAIGPLGNALGNTGGEEMHQLTISEMPSHSHDMTGYRDYQGAGSDGRGFAYTGGVVNGVNSQMRLTLNTGGDQLHNNIQPSIIVNYIIKY